MARPKTPLLSIDAAGTLGDRLTFTHRQNLNVITIKPTPTDRRTLLQQYQRWLYQDYSYYWQTLTPEQKASWRGYYKHLRLPTYAHYLRYHLKHLPIHAAIWHLDTLLDGTSPDSSRNANTLTVYGTSPVPAVIDGGLSFDGITDWATAPGTPSLDLKTTLTLESFLTFDQNFADWATLIGKDVVAICYAILIGPGGSIRAWLRQSDNTLILLAEAAYLTHGQTYHLAMTADGSYLHLLVDGIETPNSPMLYDGTILSEPTTRIVIGRRFANRLPGIIDQAGIYNVALPQSLIKNHAERTYP